MRDEAAAKAEADAKEKEKIDKINHADSLIFNTEKQLNELGDKLPADKKQPIEAALNKLKEAHKAQDLPGIDAATEELNKVFHAASQDMYNAQQQQQGGAQQQGNPEPNQGSNDGDNITDVDFEEVK